MVKMLEVVSSKGVENYDWEDVDSRKKKADSKDHAVKLNNTNNGTNDNNVDTTPMPSQESSTLKALADHNNNGGSSKKKKRESNSHELLRESYKGSLFLVLEYIEHDLTGLLDMAYKFSEVQAKSLMWQLLDVLEYMHERYVFDLVSCLLCVLYFCSLANSMHSTIVYCYFSTIANSFIEI